MMPSAVARETENPETDKRRSKAGFCWPRTWVHNASPSTESPPKGPDRIADLAQKERSGAKGRRRRGHGPGWAPLHKGERRDCFVLVTLGVLGAFRGARRGREDACFPHPQSQSLVSREGLVHRTRRHSSGCIGPLCWGGQGGIAPPGASPGEIQLLTNP